MTVERVDPFAGLGGDTPAPKPVLPAFDVKPHAAKPVDFRELDQIASEQNFPSRQEKPRRKQRRHRTGRTAQLNIKATPAIADRFCALADMRKVALCELLEQAMDALEAHIRKTGK
jgi:hypothetical protein